MFRQRGIGLAFALLLAVTRLSVWAEDKTNQNVARWSVLLGAGAALSPDYEGSDEYGVLPVPTLVATWNDRVFFNVREGLGVNFRAGDFYITPVIGFDSGRAEDANRDLDGLGNIDAAATANLNLDYRLNNVTATVGGRHYLGGAYGTELTARLRYTILIRREDRRHGPRPPVAIMPRASLVWADERYMDAYFGIDDRQAGRSGLSLYDVGPGVKSAALDIEVAYPLTQNWILSGAFYYTHLFPDVADSPIVQSDSQFLGALILIYRFSRSNQND